ncbi:histone-lysine N-methyltransferase SUVR3 isoform X2 [Cucurbita maxima]|uniref:Histone-lysine N-methyltransferase SUVR3 isoform X2 n=1 Tax=Cucurbita maxima TaxID=3661 RepID=A0A6J1J3G6_CUCMA|nr:histone-lysine N-methyltransferase SUVR3 isoform X2 [Cucurbita maxima]
MPQAGSKKCLKTSEAEEEDLTSGLLHCAHLVLPWLTSLELASISLSCKFLNATSKSITLRRILDASRSIENIPIPFHPSINDCPYAFFIYTPTSIIPDHRIERQCWGSISDSQSSHVGSESMSLVDDLGGDVSGCDCENCGEYEFQCPCSSLDGLEDVATECGPRCSCGLECENRLTQRGICVRLKISRDEKKGWGLYADELIKKGTFICELLTTGESRRRQKIYDARAKGGRFTSSLLVVREHLPSGNACLRTNIDATWIGNVGRFVNHSCDGGNLVTRLVRSTGVMLPRLCFYASRSISKDEELTFSYGDIRVNPEGLKCFCGSSCCLGTLPSENT